jgi:hypothetical protein
MDAILPSSPVRRKRELAVTLCRVTRKILSTKLPLPMPPHWTFRPGSTSVLGSIFSRMNPSAPVHQTVLAFRTQCQLQR